MQNPLKLQGDSVKFYLLSQQSLFLLIYDKRFLTQLKMLFIFLDLLYNKLKFFIQSCILLIIFRLQFSPALISLFIFLILIFDCSFFLLINIFLFSPLFLYLFFLIYFATIFTITVIYFKRL